MEENNKVLVNKGIYNLLKKIVTDKKIIILLESDVESGYLNNILSCIVENNDKEYKKKMVLIRKIVNNFDRISNVYNCFNDKRDDESLNDLYISTKEEFSKTKKYTKYYTIIKKSFEEQKIDKKMIVNICDSLDDSEIINLYCKYRRFINNKKITLIKEEIENNHMNLIINKLSSVLNNQYAFKPPIYINRYTKDYVEANLSVYNSTEDEVLQLAKEVNYRYNYMLISKAKKYKWYNYFKEIKEKKRNREKYDLNEKTIYSQYKENLEHLKFYIQSFKFIEEVINVNIEEEIEKYLLEEDDLFNYFNNIKSSLLIYRDFVTIKEKIDMTDENVLNILNIFYNSLNDKSDLKNIIKFIPQFYKYNMIDVLEKNEQDNLVLYEDIEKYFNEVLIAIKTLKEFKKSEFIESNKFLIVKNNAINEMENKQDIENIIYESEILEDKYNESFKESIEEFHYNDESMVILNNVNKILISFGYKTKIVDDNLLQVFISDYDYLYISFDNVEDVLKKIQQTLNLMANGYKILFIWTRDWWMDKGGEINRIKEALGKV